MTRTLAVAGSKGGVAKTTTVAALGAAFAGLGLRALLVDLDPQASLTYALGVDPDGAGPGLHAVLLGTTAAADAVVATAEGPDLLPGDLDLTAVEVALATVEGRELVLRRALRPLTDAYDAVLLDCSPSLGLLTLNALAAADEVLLPLQCEMLGHRGVGQLLDTVDDVRRLLSPGLVVRGVLPTMFDVRSTHQRAVLDDAGRRFGVPVITPAVPRSVRVAEAPALGRSVLTTAPRSAAARAYREVATGLVRAWAAEPGP